MCKQNNNATSSLFEIISELENEARSYYSSVNSSIDSVFVDNEEFTKEYNNAYSRFSLVISDHISRCEEHILLLTNLIQEADNNNNAKETEMLSERFEKYVTFSKGISNFIRQNEDMIKQSNSINKKDILISIQNLLTTIQLYKKELQPNT